MKKKRRGPRKTGLTPAFSIQLHTEQLQLIGHMSRVQKVSKGQVIRHLIQQALNG